MPMDRSHLKEVYPNLIQYLRRVNQGEVVAKAKKMFMATLAFYKVYLPHLMNLAISGKFLLQQTFRSR